MNKLKINLKKDTFYINDSGCVIGVIYFSIGDYFFPSKGWDDFVVAILDWLTQVIIELNFDKKKTVEMPFLEGSFLVSISLNKNSQSTIKFIEGDRLSGQKEIIRKTLTLPFEDLKNEVKTACKTILQMREFKELDFKDGYESLKKSYELLCKC